MTVANAPQRQRMLAAMGIDVYELRGAKAAAPAAPRRAVFVAAHGVRGDARLARLIARLPAALGAAPAQIAWLEADAGGALPPPPGPQAYLVFGAAMARALGAQLSTIEQNACVIAVTAEPRDLPGGVAGKRALWQALKPLARHLRARD
jgi:hypothetical protein